MGYNDQLYFSLLPLLIANVSMISAVLLFGLFWPGRLRKIENIKRLHSSFLGIFFREFWDWLTTPIVKLFIFIRFSPNMITSLSIFMSIYTGYLFFIGNIGAAGWMVGLSGSMDTFDGRVARETGKSTVSGAFYDACVDRYSDALIYMGIALYFAGKGYSSANGTFSITTTDFIMILITIVLIIGTEVMSYVKARGEVLGVDTKRGLMQRPERVAMLGVLSALNPIAVVLLDQYSLPKDLVFNIVITVMALLVNFSAVSRLISIFKDIKKSEIENE